MFVEPVRVMLCPACGNCPSVDIDDKSVRIGENENTVTLTHAEWNDLVTRVCHGELKAVQHTVEPHHAV